jgi:hypothetical protein
MASERTPTKSTYSSKLARSATDMPPSDIGPMHTNGSEEGVQFDPEGAAWFSGVVSYCTTTSAGLARAGSIARESTYSTIAE